MTATWMRTVGRLLLGVFMAVAISGCSSDQPMAPSSAVTNAGYLVTPGEQVQFAARVATMDQNQRRLTFVGQPDTVIANHNCQIVRLNNGTDAPIPFSEIHPGDSLQVQGYRQQQRDVIATRLRVCQDGVGAYDISFRDTILTIDYANNSFTVKGRTDVITVDANTVIWGQIVVPQGGSNALSGDQVQNQHNYSYGGDKNGTVLIDTVLAFSDLAVGDVVVVKANEVSPGVLLAVTIKVANCGAHSCYKFYSYLASVDAIARIVTFTDQPWIGYVCPGAKLTGLSDETLTLADFAIGDYVYVKGSATTGDTLRICQMSKETL